MKTRIFCAVLAVGLLAVQAGPGVAQTTQTAPPPAAPPSPETVVAIVNGTKITRADVIASAKSLPQQYQQQIEAIFPALIDRLVDLTLLGEEGRKQNLQEDPEVKAEIAQRADQVIQEALIRRHLKEAMTEDAIKARYDQFVKETPPQTEVHARHILVETEAEAKDIITQLAAGADFAQLAKEKSKDPSAKENGGDLGYFAEGQMVPEFSKAAFAMQVGETSKEPVKTDFGWHVIKVEDRRQKAAPTLEEARAQIQETLSGELMNSYIESLHKGATVQKFNPDGTPIMPKPVDQQ
jgi:peptidyl-prolyl cis-trans isomerase C